MLCGCGDDAIAWIACVPFANVDIIVCDKCVKVVNSCGIVCCAYADNLAGLDILPYHNVTAGYYLPTVTEVYGLLWVQSCIYDRVLTVRTCYYFSRCLVVVRIC